MLSLLSEMLTGDPIWLIIACVGTAILSYSFGCLNGAVTVSRLVFKDDVRSYGSGNGGMTNFCRVYGGPWTVVVVLCDVLKAVISVQFAVWLFHAISPELIPFGKYWAGLFCLLGHMFPCNYQFRGGKGVLSGGFIALMIDWRVGLVVWCGFLILSVLSGYVSLGSVWGGASFPFATWFIFHDWLLTGMGVLMGGLLVWKHRANIKRLLTHKEPKFTFKMKGTIPPGSDVQDPQPDGETAPEEECGE